MAGEDFGNLADEVPGCFFLYAIGKKSGERLHTDCYDFNDECIEDICEVWFRIMRDRLGMRD